MAQVDKRTLESLQELGLSLYEGKLYLGLLTHGPQNGNELSRTSGVPSSKVYATLDKLTAAGIINHINRGSSSQYACISPEELVMRLRDRYSKPLEYLEETLPLLRSELPDLDIVQIANAEVLVAHARAIIAAAREEILISLWDESLEELREELKAADRRGVRIFTMIYGKSVLEFGSSEHHSYRETIASRIEGHMLTLVADGREALIVHIPERGEPMGIHTRNPVLRLVAEEYLRHELILQKAKKLTGYREWDEWLHRDADVRALTLGRSGRESDVSPDVSIGVGAT